MPSPTRPTNGAGAVKRKRPLRAEPTSWTTETHVDHSGRVREVLVLDDTPSPSLLVPINPNSNSNSNNTYTNGNGNANGNGMQEERTIKPQPRRTRQAARLEQESQTTGTATTTASQQLQLAPPQAPVRHREEEYAAAPAPKRRKRDVVEPVKVVKAEAGGDPWRERRDPAVPPSYDDKEGHYIIVPGDVIGNNSRYKIHRLLGQGTFGKVVECTDLHHPGRRRGEDHRVAVKIIRAIQKYRDASRIECRVLDRLKQADPQNRHQCIHAQAVFDFRNHVCIVSELLGMCVYDFLKENDFQPFPRDQIHSFAKQLLDSVGFLHELGLIHTDLKPENILLVNHAYREVQISPPTKRSPGKYRKVLNNTTIRLIDFGSATFENEYHSSVVSTRHYRAPEIILNLGWSYPCDAYSIGCILVEFFTGTALFQTHDNVEHLAMMEAVMGKMPHRFAEVGREKKPEFFTKDAKLDWPKPRASRQSKKDVRALKPLDQIIPPSDIINTRFMDLVKKLLGFDPTTRMIVRDALTHGFLQLHVLPDFPEYDDGYS